MNLKIIKIQGQALLFNRTVQSVCVNIQILSPLKYETELVISINAHLWSNKVKYLKPQIIEMVSAIIAKSDFIQSKNVLII